MCTLAWPTYDKNAWQANMSWVSRAFINAVADWSEIKTCQTSVLGKSIFPNVFVKASNICEKNRDGMTDNHETSNGNRLCKRLPGRKTEQSKLWWKEENSSTNSRRFKELLVNKRLETSSLPVKKIFTNKKRMCYVHRVEFSWHFWKELEVKTVQFLGGNCIFFLSQIFAITISIIQLQVCFHLLCCIFSIKFVCSSIFF